MPLQPHVAFATSVFAPAFWSLLLPLPSPWDRGVVLMLTLLSLHTSGVGYQDLKPHAVLLVMTLQFGLQIALPLAILQWRCVASPSSLIAPPHAHVQRPAGAAHRPSLEPPPPRPPPPLEHSVLPRGTRLASWRPLPSSR